MLKKAIRQDSGIRFESSLINKHDKKLLFLELGIIYSHSQKMARRSSKISCFGKQIIEID